MASAGIIVDDSLYLLVGGTKFTHITSNSLTLGAETLDITSYDSAGWKDLDVGDKTWSMTVEAYYAMDAAEGGDDAIDDMIAGTSVTVLLSTAVSGDTTFTGSAYPTDVSINGSKGSGTTVSVTFSGTGALTKGTVV